jgi:SWI/SNF-related matrix-associated actin-dependent regulator 1 of chromatin subfamily A
MTAQFRNIFFDTSKNKFIVKFSYDAKLVDSIKASIDYKQRRYDIERKEWHVNKEAHKELHEWGELNGFNIAGTALQHMKDVVNAKVAAFEIPDMPEGNINIPLKVEPYLYQKQGIAYNLTHDNVLIGDPPGVGKTIQAIATILGADVFPCLVICPNHLKLNWKQEVENLTTKKAVLINEKVLKHASQYFDSGYIQFGIINYESLPKYFAHEMKRSEVTNKVTNVELNGFEKQFRSVIWDEVHECNNTKTQRYKISIAISKSPLIKKRLALSGTPIKNKLSELMNELRLIDALGTFGGTKGFAARYVGFEKTKFGSKERPQNLEELQYLLRKNCYYRREKHEVLKQLPDKLRQIIKVDIDNRREYEEALHNFKQFLEEKKRLNPDEIEKSMRAEILVQMMYLIQISARGKMKAIKDFIEDMNSQGEKVVTFCHHKEVRESFMEKFPEAVQIAGGMTIEEKDKSVKSFQNDESVMNIIVSMKAGSTGITLTAASKVVSIELPWTPDILEQCEDRCHRIGAKDTVNAYYFLGENTIDEKMYEIINKKRMLSKSALGTNEKVETMVHGSNDIFSELLKSL